MLHWVDRLRPLADLEVELRRCHVAGLAGGRDHLAALDLLAALHVERAVMGVSRDIAVLVLDEDEIAVALHLAARISHGACLGSLDRRALWNGDIDAFVAAIGAETGDDAAASRPAEVA